MGFCLQLKLLLWKNYTLKKRKPIVLIFELIIPLVLFFILIGIRRKQPAYTVNSSDFPAYPLPSAGVIAVMQAFCDKGIRDQDGFTDFQNSSVTLFLEKLNNVSHNTNFFQPGFTPSEMDEIPDIYRSLLEDPVAVHDCFTNASQQPIGSLLRDRPAFEDFLVHNLSLPPLGINTFFNSSLNMTKLYNVIFGLDQPLSLARQARSIESKLDFLSLGHLDALFAKMKRHRQQIGLLYKAITWIFDSETDLPPPKLNLSQTIGELMDLFLSPDSLHVLLCHGKGLAYMLNQDPVSSSSENDLVEFQEKFCKLDEEKLELFSRALKHHLDVSQLITMMNLEKWNISVARNRVKKLISDLTRFMKFEMTLKELSYLARALPQDACYNLNQTEDNFYNETSSSESPPPLPAKKKAKKSQYGLLRIWLGMQKTICGEEHTQPLPPDDGEINLEELGMSKYQMDKLGILIHVLYSNPKVLFAPNNTAADEIIKKANETFELLDTITQYSQKMLNISEEIRIFLAQNSTDHSLEVLKKIRENLRRYPHMLEMFHSQSLDVFSRGSLIVDKENFLRELASIDNAACGWIHLMSGLSLNIFRGFDSQKDLLRYFQHQAYHDNVTVLASVIFNLDKNGSLPRHLTYTIRQNASFTPTTNLARNRFWFPGPRNWGYNNYYHFGFVWIQDILERAMINQYTKKDVVEPGSYIHQFPYPCYMQDQFLFMIEHVMPLCLAISWVYSVAMLVQNIVYEKEQRLKEVMKTMGLNSAVHWLAWFITSFLQMSTTAAILTLILKYGRVLTYSNPLLIFLMLEIFVVANISFSFLVSVVYSKAKLAAACAGIIYFLTYVPYMYIAVREEAAHDHIPAWIKNLACLLSTTAFGLGAKYFAFYEEIGVGVQWSNLGTSPVEDDQFTLKNVAAMMLADSIIYSLLVWYIENVHPGSYGLPKPWYFPFTKSYWLGTPPQGPQSYCRLWRWCPGSLLSVVEDDQACLLSHLMDTKYFEADPQHLKLAVCIDNLMKHYKSGNKMAVNRLSLNLYEGQITSFLGHNGAGKTTTISLLTGLFPPTHGRAIIYGHDIRTEMDLIRQSMGMCPQHNVLFDELTVEEHLWFYSRLKNNPSKDIDLELEKMMADLNLPMKKVDYLSGGMKRKLSVAIAFVGGSRVVILDEPTAGVDPYSRRAIWDLILKYKKDRTILLSTHHMDEADVLGDRIAIISNGRLQCCGSPLFLKNNLGDGYHLFLVKSDPGCPTEPLTALIKRHISGATLVDDSPRELHYILPLSQSSRYGELFGALDQSLGALRVTSYGIKHCTLEEVFLKVASQDELAKGETNGFGHPVDISDEPEANGVASTLGPRPKPGHKKRFSDDGRANYHKLEPIGSQKKAGAGGSSLEGSSGQRQEGAGKHRVEGNLLLLQQCGAILAKRYWYTKRNWKGLFSQILLPAFFVSVAMSVALTAPKLEDLPPMVLSPVQYFNLTQPKGNVIPFANNARDSRWETDANSSSLVNTLIHLPSGVGATCVLKHAFNNTFERDLNFTVREFSLLAKYFEPSCEGVFLPGLPPKNFVPLPPTASPQSSTSPIYNVSVDPTVAPKDRFYPYCHCSEDGTGFVCQNYGYTLPPEHRVVTGDILLDISGQKELEYYLHTTDAYRQRRYGAFSFGHERDYVPPEFGRDAPPIFRKIAVRNVAKVWYNNKGYHSLPTYINSLNNAILRANLPREMGNPAAYGITVINHPMTDTSYMLSKDQIIQGTDVLIAIFIIVAMSFVPASFVLFLVYERYVKAKHLHAVSGVHPVVYWVSNYLWDMCSYVLPATCCVLILLVFDIPAYSSRKNFPAVVALFLMYGWSITPVMYPVSFIFREPSTAYIFLIVINLFVGITCVVTSFLLEVFSYDAYLGQVHRVLRTLFLFFPNYCLGRGLMDIAFNEYQNFFLFKTGQYGKMKSPFAWGLVTRNLVAMAFSGLGFFLLTLLLEYNFFRKAKNILVMTKEQKSEDQDVANERKRVLSGKANSDLIRLVNLTKIYQTRKLGQNLAVDRLCLGIPKGECLGLLGVNGAGKSTTFKMLTGDTAITAGDAYLNSYSVQSEINMVQQHIGYCPQFDALYDELTAREHLMLYARFRGIPSCDEKAVVEWALTKLDLIPYADKLARTFSGGNRRKLATAIALLGAPPIILLDEPTTGMDPHTRRFLWDLILEIVRGGRSVVLTSHCMEECEALCTRLGIMVNGRLRCLGSTQHLKNKFGEGYSIVLRSSSQHEVPDWVRNKFPDAVLKEKHFNLYQYELRSHNISLSYVFSTLEQGLRDLPIDEYSVCQNTLDNVFINFVKQQTDSRGHQPLTPAEEDCLDDTGDDFAANLQRSHSRLAFLNLDLDA